MPVASAVIPTYNRAGQIEGAIETALAQTYPDIEVVVVNDGSTDETRAVLDRYVDDDRVQVVQNEENRGIAASRNRGVKAANGEYICVLDDDDRWHPEKVAKQVALLERRSADYAAVYAGGVVRENGHVRQILTPERRGNVYPEILAGLGMHPHSGHVIRKSHLVEVGGYDPAFGSTDDWDFAIRLAKQYKYDYIPELLVERTVHGDNASTHPEHLDSCERILTAYREEIERYPAVERAFHANLDQTRGFMAIKQGKRAAARRYFWSAFRREPTPLRAALVGTAVLGTRAFDAIDTVRRAVLDTRLRWSSTYEGPF